MAPILHNLMSKPEVKGTVMNLTHGPTTQLISSQQRLGKKAKVTKFPLLMQLHKHFNAELSNKI